MLVYGIEGNEALVIRPKSASGIPQGLPEFLLYFPHLLFLVFFSMVITKQDAVRRARPEVEVHSQQCPAARA
jgi:hypothetical protein